MSLDISPEHQEFISQELASGRFTSERELITEALELLRDHQELRKLKQGIAQLERGEGLMYGLNDRPRFLADVLGDNLTSSTKDILDGPSLDDTDLTRHKSIDRNIEP